MISFRITPAQPDPPAGGLVSLFVGLLSKYEESSKIYNKGSLRWLKNLGLESLMQI